MLDLNQYHLDGRTVRLKCESSDPAIVRVEGSFTWCIGADAGQARDPSAWALVNRRQLPRWKDSMTQELGPVECAVVQCARIPSMAYTDLAVFLQNLKDDPAFGGNVHLGIDAAGVGRALSDIMSKNGCQHVRCQIVPGDNEQTAVERGRRYENIGRNKLLGLTATAFHTNALKLGQFEARDALAEEFRSFERHVTDAGRVTIKGGTKEGHADMAIAVAIAYWLANHRSVSAATTFSKITNYYG